MDAHSDAILPTLLRDIRQAFVDSRPGPMSLEEAAARDSYATDEDLLRIRSRRREEERWWAIPDEDLELHGYGLPYLDGPSWRYYLPAFLVWTLNHSKDETNSLVDMVVYGLMCSEGGKEAAERYAGLNSDQRWVVYRFLVFMRDVANCDSVAAAQAIDAYWRRAARSRE